MNRSGKVSDFCCESIGLTFESVKLLLETVELFLETAEPLVHDVGELSEHASYLRNNPGCIKGNSILGYGVYTTQA